MTEYTKYIVIDVQPRTLATKCHRICAVPVDIPEPAQRTQPISIPWNDKLHIGDYIYQNNDTEEFISKAEFIRSQGNIKCARVLGADIIVTPSLYDIRNDKKNAYALKRIFASSPYINGDIIINLKSYPYNLALSDKYFYTQPGNEILVKRNEILYEWEIIRNITLDGARGIYYRDKLGR